jgi:phage tail tube protein FII
MSKKYEHTEYGTKPKVQIKINGELLDREFRNIGEAQDYLRKEGFTKEDVARQVKFIRS